MAQVGNAFRGMGKHKLAKVTDEVIHTEWCTNVGEVNGGYEVRYAELMCGMTSSSKFDKFPLAHH
jgi:hypothetical protein